MIDGVGNSYMAECMKHGEKFLGKFPKKHSIASLDSMGAGMLARIDGQMSSDFAILDPMEGGLKWIKGVPPWLRSVMLINPEVMLPGVITGRQCLHNGRCLICFDLLALQCLGLLMIFLAGGSGWSESVSLSLI